jgi:pimeloyl-ACP methyl ester carboxylesterase
MQFQAEVVLPRLLEAVGVDGRYLLFGHSDGGTIALIHAALHPQRVDAVVALAPHIMVEDISVASIAAARQAYLEGDLRERLKRHHADVDSAFFGWADAWLSPEFRHWTIESLLGRIQAPVLAVQGLADEYGTLAQVQGIGRLAPRATWHALANCGHSPHRDQPAALLLQVRDWLCANSGRG